MTVDKIWVIAEATDGEVSSTTLELVSKARELADTVECVYAGDDADDLAETLGSYGCETIHQTGDLEGQL
ncbi:MAG: electron transfer flavoprotein subunit alpha/FixB family protein, partial [Actinomycetota bacterium]